MTDILEQELKYVPEVVGGSERVTASTIVCGGMGGSALPALVVQFLGVPQSIRVHRDYGLPTDAPADAAYVAISYSGDTEETLSFARSARAKGYSLSVITSGGALLNFAKENNIPYVQVSGGFQPRDGIVATTKALLALIGADELIEQLSQGTSFIDDFEGQTQKQAEVLSATIKDSVPVFYASTRNQTLSYISKIQCNETAKIPAFSNVFPELNHNEMQGWGVGEKDQALIKPFVTVFLRDDSDDEHIQHRMELTEQLLKSKGVRTARISLRGDTRAQTFVHTWWVLRTVVHLLANEYGVSADEVPLIEEFKKSL